MRCTQLQGLSAEACEFLAKNAVKKDLCKTCGRHSGYQGRALKSTRIGMFDEYSLHQWDLITGDMAEERVQSEHWSSGPVIYLELVTPGGVISWKEEDIDFD